MIGNGIPVYVSEVGRNWNDWAIAEWGLYSLIGSRLMGIEIPIINLRWSGNRIRNPHSYKTVS